MRDDGSVSDRSGTSRPTRGTKRRRLTTRLSSTVVLVATAGVCATLLVTIPGGATGAPVPGPIYLDTSYTFGERAADLVARLTPAQRASQLVSSQAPQITSVANPLLSPSQLGGQTTLAAPPERRRHERQGGERHEHGGRHAAHRRSGRDGGERDGHGGRDGCGRRRRRCRWRRAPATRTSRWRASPG